MVSAKKPAVSRDVGKVVALVVVTGIVLLSVPVALGYLSSALSVKLEIYTPYINAVVVVILGYLIVSSLSSVVYDLGYERMGRANANFLKLVVKIAGIAVILVTLTSVFNISPAAALTAGSFAGLVVGFATQQVLSQAVAGVFLLLVRPFRPGDFLTITGQSGNVVEIGILYTILQIEDGKNFILIPNGSIISAVLIRRNSPASGPR
jgi:small-conductance mechanosensitive channel